MQYKPHKNVKCRWGEARKVSIEMAHGVVVPIGPLLWDGLIEYNSTKVLDEAAI